LADPLSFRVCFIFLPARKPSILLTKLLVSRLLIVLLKNKECTIQKLARESDVTTLIAEYCIDFIIPKLNSIEYCFFPSFLVPIDAMLSTLEYLYLAEILINSIASTQYLK
jgi:hypothetical protein